MHQLGLVETVAAALFAALLFGFATQRLGLSPILGYLLAGVAIGPHTPGILADTEIAAQLAEIGVVLLMFGIGLHFHMEELLAVRAVAIPGAVGQSLIATLLGAGLAFGCGWGPAAGLVFGLGIAVASTVVLMRVLLDARRLNTPEGHVAVGWLVVEDMLTVLVLVALPPLAAALAGGTGGVGEVARALGAAALKIAALLFLVLVAGARLLPAVLTIVARTRTRELFTLCVLALAVSIAAASAAFFGVSMALGAFLAGMVVGRSKLSHQAAADALPMRDAFAVLFFVSVGMLFDPRVLLEAPVLVFGALAIILIVKPLAALLLVARLGHSVRTGLTVALGLAQIGEFSFILAELAHGLRLLPEQGRSVLVAAAMFSITLNPLLFRAAGPLENWLRGRRRVWGWLNARAEAGGAAANERVAGELARAELDHHAVVVGYGPVGRTAARLLREFGLRPVIVDLNVDTIAELAGEQYPAIYGDAGREGVLEAAGVGKARYLLVTLPDILSSLQVIIAARGLNPQCKIFVRAHYLGERSMLEEVGATAVCYEELEAAVALAGSLLGEMGADETRIRREGKRIREELVGSPAATPSPSAEGAAKA